MLGRQPRERRRATLPAQWPLARCWRPSQCWRRHRSNGRRRRPEPSDLLACEILHVPYVFAATEVCRSNRIRYTYDGRSNTHSSAFSRVGKRLPVRNHGDRQLRICGLSHGQGGNCCKLIGKKACANGITKKCSSWGGPRLDFIPQRRWLRAASASGCWNPSRVWSQHREHCL